MTYYDAYKEYIVHHPKVAKYKPTSEKFDEAALEEVTIKLPDDTTRPSEDDFDAIVNFLFASRTLHTMYKEMYGLIKEILPSLNMSGKEICEYFIGVQNRNFHIIFNKYVKNLKNVKSQYSTLSDLSDFRIEPDDRNLSALPMRSNMETATDFTGLILNYLRYFLDKSFSQPDVNPNQFAGRIQYVADLANIGYLFKCLYDSVLYEGGRISQLDNKGKTLFSYDDEEKQRLIKAGDLLFENRKMAFYAKLKFSGKLSCLSSYYRTYRIKSILVENGYIKLSFGQGRNKSIDDVFRYFDASIQAYYPFLDLKQKLPNLKDVSFEEILIVYGALQHIVHYVVEKGHFENGLYKSIDFNVIPSKIRKWDLVDYISKLVTIKKSTIVQCVNLLEASWDKANNIWANPIYPIDDYELLPFFPIMYTAPYYVMDEILHQGGIPLDTRGKMFEQYIYNTLSNKHIPFYMHCLPSRKYGIKGEEEEIDVLVELKDVVLIADAKCILYPMEPMNYHDAWSRLVEGAEQVERKMAFLKKHPEYFNELGDYSGKKIIPFVVTNYPYYTGCNHNGIYITDGPSFLAYMTGENTLTRRELGNQQVGAVQLKKLYNNEDEYNVNFEEFLHNNPQKALFLKDISMEDNTLYKQGDIEWVSRSAQYQNDKQFNISNQR